MIRASRTMQAMPNWPIMHIEISVLTPMRLARNPDEVVVGQHGVMIRKGGHGGLFLPQVPVEQNWDHDEYLFDVVLDESRSARRCMAQA